MLFPTPLLPEKKPRVVVTGAGIVTGHGVGWCPNAEGFQVGRPVFRPVSLFDVSRQRVQLAAEVDLPVSLPTTRLSSRQIARLDRASRMLLLASLEAWNQAATCGSESVPIVLGTTAGGMSLGEDYFRSATVPPYRHPHQLSRALLYQAQTQARLVLEAIGIMGPVTVISNACASGSNAIGHAGELIRRGLTRRVLAGGYDALSLLVFSGFDSLQALSSRACRPFDENRDGLSLGEGAAVVVLEDLESARSRGATILAELIGYGSSLDVHHLTQPHPQGDAALAAMNQACQAAQIAPEQIDYVNAHGTGTRLNDSAEAVAITRWAGSHAQRIPVSSTKSSIGHLLGGSGAVEAVVCLMALREQWLPPEPNLERADPLCKFPIVQKPCRTTVNMVLSNSFGFGGANATLILRRWA